MTLLTVAFKVDVDTFVGTRDGVPRLLEILDSFGIKATFYFSMGPDNSGKAIRRIFTRKGFLHKMLRTRAPSMYGLKTLLYGTLLPSPHIAESLPDILQKTAAAGHEVGIHCWDHVRWHDYLPKMSRDAVRDDLEKAGSLYLELLGRRAETTAAPGWTVSALSLELQDAMGLRYCSDSRGYSPYYPVFGGRKFSTLQIPTTLPTMDELLGAEGISADTINEYYLAQIKPGLNVHTIHAELEGMSQSGVFVDLLHGLRKKGARFITLSQAAEESISHDPQVCMLCMGELPGRAGLVAIQQG
ncbi:MAG: 4-deoxy-4-formamido-L-arabinose-phosphoundecaprenol deformylase [Deltaproteobacteria bacterium]|nr:4-deoxy-4-formamido-L-arabinose-phosphoundecaprenol deformylase [Deltaproteobacteria bacterium]